MSVVQASPLPAGREEAVAYLTRLRKRTVPEALRNARREGRVALQPRCGVGGHEAMRALLEDLEREANPDILSVTIDSHTRLGDFFTASRTLAVAPERLNGYPLVSHGAARGRELNECVAAPLEVRHGSPDPRVLFDVAIASGITSFEGGGIGYNIPYCKKVPLARSLSCWREIDAACGELAHAGVEVDRELFGTLTAVLMPPSLSLAISVIEAIAAATEGVTCITIAYPQGGEAIQDVAALRCVERLARRYLPGGTAVFCALHEYMGPFPTDRAAAEALIFYGALIARLGGAAKVVTKSCEEARRLPSVEANVAGLLTSRMAQSKLLDFISLDEGRIEEEMSWIEREVAELVEHLLERPRLDRAVTEAFARGALDVPFSASDEARREVLPARDRCGAIRYLSPGRLPFSAQVRARNSRLLEESGRLPLRSGAQTAGSRQRCGSTLRIEGLISQVLADVNHFAA